MALVVANSVFTHLVTNSPYLAIVKIDTFTGVILVDDVTWGTVTRPSKWRHVALILTAQERTQGHITMSTYSVIGFIFS